MNTTGARHTTLVGLTHAKKSATAAPALERQSSKGSDEGTVVKPLKSSTGLARRKSSVHGDDRARVFRSTRSDTHLPRLGGLTTLSNRRPSVKKHSSEDKRSGKKTTGDDEDWDSGEEVNDNRAETQIVDKAEQQPAEQPETNSDESSEEDEDDEEHLEMKTRGSRSHHTQRAGHTQSQAGRARAPAPEQQAAPAPVARSRSRSRTVQNSSRDRRKSNARRSSPNEKDRAHSHVFNRTKSQIGFDLGESPRSTVHMGGNQSLYPDTEYEGLVTSPAAIEVKQEQVELVTDPRRQDSATTNKSNHLNALSAKSTPDLDNSEHNPEFPFHASTQQPQSSTRSQHDQRASHIPADTVSLKVEQPQAPSPTGSDSNTLIGSQASPARASTPRSQAPTHSATLPASQYSTPIKPVHKHVRTRNSHTSLRSLASMRMAGPPPHPLSSPSTARSRITSMNSRSSATIAAPKVSKEEARGLWSTSPTEVMSLHTDANSQIGEIPKISVARTGSSRSLRDYFAGTQSRAGKEGEKTLEALRKSSFSSQIAGLPRVNSSSTLGTGGTTGGPVRLSAHSVAQAAARLPTTSPLSASGYGDQQMESSQVGLISRFLTPSSWHPKLTTGPTKEKNQKYRSNTSPHMIASKKENVFPESPFAAAHASLVRTLMEDGAIPASQVQSINTPTTRDRHPLANEDGHSGRSRLAGRDGKFLRDSGEVVWGLTPFEMSARRCLDQRKNAVKLSTGGPLGPLPP